MLVDLAEMKYLVTLNLSKTENDFDGKQEQVLWKCRSNKQLCVGFGLLLTKLLQHTAALCDPSYSGGIVCLF